MEKSNILIIVVNQLSFKEQKFLNRLKNNKNYDKKIFIIHNLQFFCDIKSIEEYIENVLKKSIFSNLDKRFISSFIIPNFSKSKYDEKAYYYKEKVIGNENNDFLYSEQKINHLFMGKEDSEAGKFFNDQTIEYIRYEIKGETKKKIFDVIKEIKEFLSFNSILYMIKEDNKDRPIEEDEFEIDEHDDCNYLKCKNKNFILKDLYSMKWELHILYQIIQFLHHIFVTKEDI